MKTPYKILTILGLLISLAASSQNIPSGNEQHYEPVYYNFHFRKLYYQGNTLPGDVFLDMCRDIKDSAIQYQIARYDHYTMNKMKMGLVTVGAGSAGFLLFGAAAGNTGAEASDRLVSGNCIGIGLACMLTIPVMAIASAIPHQRRKAVLFHDLPIAYNKYVESLNQKNKQP